MGSKYEKMLMMNSPRFTRPQCAPSLFVTFGATGENAFNFNFNWSDQMKLMDFGTVNKGFGGVEKAICL